MKKGLTGVTTKKLYMGTFNWYGETHTLYTHSHTPALARLQLLQQLAEKIRYEFPYVARYFVTEGHHTITQIVKEDKNEQKDPEVQKDRVPIQRTLFPGTPFEDA
jgi:hypothetical protein